MKDSLPFPQGDPSEERFVDAALREHHRLGGAERDEDLVRSILRETVAKVDPAPILSERRREDQKLWFIGVASAAAIVAVLATLLAVLPFRSDSRDIEEIRFVVQYAPEEETIVAFSESPPQKEAAPLSAPIAFDIDLSPVKPSIPSFSKLEEIQPSFPPSFSELRRPETAELRLRIEADETNHLEDRRVYRGDVEVRHDRFRLDSDLVELISPAGLEIDERARLISSHALLEQMSPVRRVLADSLVYEPYLERFTLKGVVFLETEEGMLNSFSLEDVVYLTRETLVVQKSLQAP